MRDLIQYKGYFGSYHLDEKGSVFYGKLEYIKALVSYEASSAADLYKAFVEAVDDYLAMCEQQGIMPEKPFKGSFNVRVGPKLHQALVLEANRQSVSLNALVCSRLKSAYMSTRRVVQ